MALKTNWVERWRGGEVEKMSPKTWTLPATFVLGSGKHQTIPEKTKNKAHFLEFRLHEATYDNAELCTDIHAVGTHVMLVRTWKKCVTYCFVCLSFWLESVLVSWRKNFLAVPTIHLLCVLYLQAFPLNQLYDCCALTYHRKPLEISVLVEHVWVRVAHSCIILYEFVANDTLGFYDLSYLN